MEQHHGVARVLNSKFMEQAVETATQHTAMPARGVTNGARPRPSGSLGRCLCGPHGCGFNMQLVFRIRAHSWQYMAGSTRLAVHSWQRLVVSRVWSPKPETPEPNRLNTGLAAAALSGPTCGPAGGTIALALWHIHARRSRLAGGTAYFELPACTGARPRSAKRYDLPPPLIVARAARGRRCEPPSAGGTAGVRPRAPRRAATPGWLAC